MKKLFYILLLLPIWVSGQTVIDINGGLTNTEVKGWINDTANKFRDSTSIDVLRVGGRNNYVTVDSVNGVVLHGNTTSWIDIMVSGVALGSGAAAPSLIAFVGGILRYGYNYAAQDDVSYFDIQINHDVMYDSSLHFHVHYSPETTPVAGDTCVLRFEYAWADINQTFIANDTVIVKIPMNGKVALRHYLYDYLDIPGTGKTLSSVLVGKFSRLQSSGSDTYNHYLFVHSLDFHYQINGFGSKSEYIK